MVIFLVTNIYILFGYYWSKMVIHLVFNGFLLLKITNVEQIHNTHLILGQFTLYSGKHYTVFILTENEHWNDHSGWRKGVHWFRIDFLFYLVNLANLGLVVSYRTISTIPSSLE